MDCKNLHWYVISVTSGKEIKTRDYRDTHREHNPLIKVEDAVEIDSSDMTPEEVVDFIMSRFF